MTLFIRRRRGTAVPPDSQGSRELSPIRARMAVVKTFNGDVTTARHIWEFETRCRFARWLLEDGRISEWVDGYE